MSFVRVIVILGIVLYNTQNNTIFATIGPNEAFSHFIQHKNHVLDVEKISSFLVSIVTECALRCVRHVSCLSFNIKEDTTENSTQMTCELLPMDLYNASLKFHESEEFHHWSFIVSEVYFLICDVFLHMHLHGTLHVTSFEQEIFRKNITVESRFL